MYSYIYLSILSISIYIYLDNYTHFDLHTIYQTISISNSLDLYLYQIPKYPFINQRI